MQFPESWLREFCNPPITTAELAELLTMAGLEVEETRPVAPPCKGVVVAEIIEAMPHANADRLRVCKVLAGAHSPDGPLQIVCGAPNARVGIRVPLALVGAELPPGEEGAAPFAIKVGKLRGVDSFGMLCSARELKLSDEHGGLLELPADAPVGADVRTVLGLDDAVFTLKLTPNLAHALSVYGVAREVSALTGAPLLTPLIEAIPPTHDQTLPVQVEASDLCGRFSGRIVRDVNTKAKTPAWMVERLARCGQRPVTALVDISNYVMFEYGRPTHIFDLDKIHDRLIVRWGRVGERLKLLNGNTIDIDASVGVIADTQAVESLAGIMGGDATAVSDDTRHVFVEAAFWWPQAVAGRSRRFNFSTDAAHRFERGVDPALTAEHIERVTRLILDICGGEAGPLDDQVLSLPAAQPVTLRVARAARVIGMPLTQAQCVRVFGRLGFAFTEGLGTITVKPPTWRFDLQIEEDLIEEVARIVGYQHLPQTPPVAPIRARAQGESHRSPHAVRQTMAALDYQETINYSFVEERWEQQLAGNHTPVRVLNPIAAPLAVMRSSLLGSLLGVLQYNLARRASRVRVFEVGRVFRRDASAGDGPASVAGVSQPLRLGALAYGAAAMAQWGQAARGVDFFDIKGDIESLLAPRKVVFVADTHPALHPGRCARVELDGRAIGHVGELHPQWRQAYELPQAPLLFELELDAVQARDLPIAQPVPRHQSSWRDIALVVRDDVAHDRLVGTLVQDPSGLVRSVLLFDVYRPNGPGGDIGAGEHSMALRLELRDEQANLTDERIDAAVAAALQRAQAAFAARLRG